MYALAPDINIVDPDDVDDETITQPRTRIAPPAPLAFVPAVAGIEFGEDTEEEGPSIVTPSVVFDDCYDQAYLLGVVA